MHHQRPRQKSASLLCRMIVVFAIICLAATVQPSAETSTGTFAKGAPDATEKDKTTEIENSNDIKSDKYSSYKFGTETKRKQRALPSQELLESADIDNLYEYASSEEDASDLYSRLRNKRYPQIRFGRSGSSLIPSIRFGRSDNSMIPNLRFGRSMIPTLRVGRSGESMIPNMRFGRSGKSVIPNIRFGRSDNTMIPNIRFGRSSEVSMIPNIRFGRYALDDLDRNVDFVDESELEDYLEDSDGYSDEMLDIDSEVNSDETSEKISKRQTNDSNDSIIPQIRYGRSIIKGKMDQSGSPAVFILPNIRPGRSLNAKTEQQNEKLKLPNFKLLPYPRPGRSTNSNRVVSEPYYGYLNKFLGLFSEFRRSNTNSDHKKEAAKPLEMLFLDDEPEKIDAVKFTNKLPVKDSSIYVIPYPRPGKRSSGQIKNKGVAFQSNKLKSRTNKLSDYVLPYPRPGRASYIVPNIRTGKSTIPILRTG